MVNSDSDSDELAKRLDEIRNQTKKSRTTPKTTPRKSPKELRRAERQELFVPNPFSTPAPSSSPLTPPSTVARHPTFVFPQVSLLNLNISSAPPVSTPPPATTTPSTTPTSTPPGSPSHSSSNMGSNGTTIVVDPHRSIPKFSGVHCATKIGEFIRQLDQYFNTHKVTSDAVKIDECKQNLHPTEGEASGVVNNLEDFDVETWDQFKYALRDHFAPKTSRTVFSGMAELLESRWNPGETAQTFLARLQGMAKSIMAANDSKPVKGYPVTASVLKMIVAGKLYAHMDDRGRAKMETKYDGNNPVGANYTALTTSEPGYYAFKRVPEKNASVRMVHDDSTSSKATNARDENPRSRKSKPQPSRKPPSGARGFPAAAGPSKGSGRNSSQLPPPNNKTECFKCRKFGHYSTECHGKPHCIRCRRDGHRTGRDGKCLFLPQDGHAAADTRSNRKDSPRRAKIRLMQQIIEDYGLDDRNSGADFL